MGIKGAIIGVVLMLLYWTIIDTDVDADEYHTISEEALGQTVEARRFLASDHYSVWLEVMTLADLEASIEAYYSAGAERVFFADVLEVTELVQRECRRMDAEPGAGDSQRTDPEFATAGGKALLFENPEGSAFPVLINTFGSYKRIEMALGDRALEQTAQVLAELTKPELPRSIGEAIHTYRFI